MLYRFFILFIFLFSSCTKPSNKESIAQTGDIKQNAATNITHSIGEVLSPESRSLVKNWQEYIEVEKVISKYYNISVTKATSNAEELSIATQQLKDSIRVERFKQPDLKIRLNILHNTALRLNDLEKIPHISDNEIKTEISNLINVFTSITTKLNNITSQEILEKGLKRN